MDAEWKRWTLENLDRGCIPDEVLGILLENNFPVYAIRQAMGERFPAQSPRLGEVRPLSYVDYRRLANIAVIHREGVKRVETDRMQVYIADDFLSKADCEKTLGLVESNLVKPHIHKADDQYFRTNKTCHLSFLDDPWVAELDQKIATKMGINLIYSEGTQAQNYDGGEEVKDHYDFFEPGTIKYKEFAGAMGNRTWTCMIYLRDTEAGGGTRFTTLDKTFYPKQGRALIWNNLYADGMPNYESLHCGMPVEKGTKTIITKWFRERSTVSMFTE